MVAAVPATAFASEVEDVAPTVGEPGDWTPTMAELLEDILADHGLALEDDMALPPLARMAQPVITRGDGEPMDRLAGRTDTKDKPVLMVHGRDNYDMGGYANFRNLFINTYGFTGGVHRVGYYGGECSVEYNSEHHGSHNTWFGGSGEHSSKTGCTGGSGAQVHDLQTDVRHISYHLAWAIHDHFTAAGKTVDIVGHSLGGLLVRYAIAHTGDASWPATLNVEDVTTLGSPHGGLGTSWCKWSPWSDVRQLCSDSSFITWMDANAQNTQSSWPTDWTLMGSDCDGWVAWNLAVDMDAAHKVVNVSPCNGHSDYYTDLSTSNDATQDYMDAPSTSWSRWTSAPHAGKWTVQASQYGSW